MVKQYIAAPPALLRLLAASACLFWFAPLLYAQPAGGQPIHFRVNGPAERLEMLVNSSRILTLEHNIPRLLVNNPDIVRATPLSPNQVQVSALKPGVTQVNMWDENDTVYSVDVVVYGDARELASLLQSEFPEATLRVTPLASSVAISGYVPSADMVGRIERMAADYYPSVINNLTVGGVQQVLLHVEVMEVSRTKLRSLGIDWSHASGSSLSLQTTGIAGSHTFRLGIVDGSSSFISFIEALRQHNLAKLLSKPTLVTVSGRPASFNSGGEFAYDVAQGFGNISTQFREFGTRVDFVPIVLGNGHIRLEVRPQVTEIDFTLASASGVPGLRSRWADTAVEMNAGQTLALAGLIHSRVESENKGVPWLADLPWVGAAFRRVQEKVNEVELLILVTPEFVAALDPHELPPCVPGGLTASPGDRDLYYRGYLEVPRWSPAEAPGRQNILWQEEIPPGAAYDVRTGQPFALEAADRRDPQGGGDGDGLRRNTARRLPTALQDRQAQSPNSTNSTPQSSPNQHNRPQQPAGSDGDQPPGFLGAIGYDVLN